MKISRKADWYKLFNLNIFNRTIVLDTNNSSEIKYEDIKNKKWCIRNMREYNAPFYEIDFGYLMNIINCNLKDIQIAEKAPDEHIIIQGNYKGNFAEVTFEKEAMGILTRADNYRLKPWKRISRLQLIDIIGYENVNYMNELIEIFCAKENSTDINDNPVIEFSYYSKPIGILNKRLIIWEIRHY